MVEVRVRVSIFQTFMWQ